MIHDIFICNLECRLLYGDNRTFQKPDNYPVIDLGDKRIHTLKVNDIILSILYSQIDNFAALQFLRDLKRFIEKRINEITEKTVEDNYFVLVNLLQNVSEIGLALETENKSEDVYIDITYTINALLSKKNEIIQNYIQGEMKANIKGFKIHTSSDYAISSSVGNGIVYISPVKFSNFNFQKLMFKLHKNENEYTFECGCKEVFKHLEICIPIGKTAFSTKITKTNGKAEFDIQAGVVRWTFHDFRFNKEIITIIPQKYEEEIEYRSIFINFCVDEISDINIKIESCEMLDKSQKRFWVKNQVKSGNYEIRQF